MILVTLGTQDKSFKRLLDMVEDCIDNGLIKEDVIVQAGFTKYFSKDMQIFDFVSPEEMKKYIKKSSYIIMHGGVGSIFDAIKQKKKVIAVARLKEYKEHTNNHQLEIIKEFSKKGLILDGTYDLVKAIKKINTFEPKTYLSNNSNFIDLITNFIEKN